MSTRFLATALTTALFTAGLAGPASADPGEGCAGLPETPAAYVCVVSLTPTEGLPGADTTPIPVRVPPVCYVAGCTQPTTVNVPVPHTTEPTGNVAVLWYQGTYYPIGIGLDVIWPLVDEVQVLAGNVVGIVTGAVDDLPSSGEIIRAVLDVVDPVVADVQAQVAEVQAEVAYIVERLPRAIEVIQERVDDLLPEQQTLNGVVRIVQGVLDDEYCLC